MDFVKKQFEESRFQLVPLRYVSDVVLGKMLTPENKGGMTLKPYLRSLNVQDGHLDTSSVNEMWFTNSELEKLTLRPGDLLVNEGGEVGRSSLVHGLVTDMGFQNSLNCVRPFKELTPEFLSYVFNYYFFIGYFDSVVDRVSIPHLTKDKLSQVRVPIPQLEEQQLISRYLDKKTEQIDSLIEKIQRKIELLKEQRTSLINQCVTKGLDPNVEMKDSGVEWIGDIPSHWEKTRIKFCSISKSGSTPNTNEEKYWNGDIPWVSPKDMKKDEISDSIDKVTRDSVDESGLSMVDEGSILIVVRSGILHRKLPVGITTKPLTINQDMKSFSVDPESLNSKFLFYYLKGISGSVLNLWTKQGGGGQKSIDVNELQNGTLVLPSVSEQTKITSFLDKKTNESDRLIELMLRKIDLITEYRKSLISSVVTGKVRVTEDMV